ncbi:MAG TPA: TlpA disulfide reductase family protein [Candidatus Limnocylindria bacterium]|nr:TlpA disulfide reductase family protein [Candidatus Limnocylindria bacterium]
MKRFGWTALLLALMLVLPLAAPAETAAPEAEAPQADNYFLSRAYTNLDGTPFDVSALQGKPLFLNIWATWCPPCVAEMPHLDELAKEYEGRIAIIGLHSEGMTVTAGEGFIANDEANEAAMALRDQMGLTYPLLNPDASLFYVMNSDDYGLRIQAVPTTWLIDGQGYVRQVLEGAADKQGWTDIIEEFLNMLEQEDAAPQG